jgi:phospholipid/cholesterol/gamma-HCH transport system permease protein
MLDGTEQFKDLFHREVVYGFIITSVSAYKGYTVEGGSVEVGKSSTDAVVTSSVLVLFSDIFLTNMLT